MSTKNYNSLDASKLVMALCVVAIHTHPLEMNTVPVVNDIYNGFVTMAVPFFFLSAGFLLANKMNYPFSGDLNESIIKKYLSKILKLYLIWTILYLPIAIYHFMSTKTSVFKALLTYIRGFIFIGEQYNSWHLWYLLATIYALMFILKLLKYNLSFKKIIFIGCIIFIISIGINYLVDYTGNLPKTLSIIQTLIKYSIATGSIFAGMFYIPIGMILSKKSFPLQLSWIMLIAGYIINIIINNPYISVLFIATSSVGLFSIVKSITFPDSPIFPFVRKMSSVIYFTHMYVWSFYYTFVYGKKTYGLDCFLATSSICIIISIVYITIKKTSKK